MPSVARSVGVQQQFNKIPVLGLVAEQAAAAPGSPVNGQIYYDTSLQRFRVRENGAWQNASAAGLAAASHTHVVGDVFPGIVGETTGDVVQWIDGTGWVNDTLTPGNFGSAYRDGPAANQSLRTLGTGAQQALPGNTRLDQLAAPTTAVTLNGQRLTNVATPTSGTDGVNKNYVDGVAAGFDPKASVRAASAPSSTFPGHTYNNTGGTSGRGQLTGMPNALDGVSLAANDRVLLKDVVTGAAFGIWVVSTLGTGANGVWDRAADFDADAEVTAGAFTFVEQGTVNDNTGWVLATNNPITIGGASGTALSWTQFSGGTSLTAGNGLSQTGNTFDVNVDGVGIEINSDILRLKDLGVVTAKIADNAVTLTGGAGQKVTGTLPVANGGTGGTTAATARTGIGAATGAVISTHNALVAGTELLLTHNLGTKNVIVAAYRVSDDYEEELAIRAASATQIGVTADIAYAADSLRFVILTIGV